jgi:ketosteroid isomerase-like protein
MKNFVILLVCAVFISGCSRTGSVDLKSEEDALRKLEADWTLFSQKKDVGAILDLYSQEAVILAPDEELISGKEKIRKITEETAADTNIIWETLNWTSEKVEVSSSGDMGYVMGYNSFKVKTVAGDVEHVTKGLDVFRKSDGKWKVILTIYNNMKPLKEIMAPLSTVEIFTKIENDWNQAIYRKDSKALENLYAKEYTYTDPDGKVFNRDEDIKDIISQNYKALSPSVLKEIKVDGYGPIVVVKGLSEVKAIQSGKNISGLYRFVDVFTYRDGRWQCVSTQQSRVSGK